VIEPTVCPVSKQRFKFYTGWTGQALQKSTKCTQNKSLVKNNLHFYPHLSELQCACWYELWWFAPPQTGCTIVHFVRCCVQHLICSGCCYLFHLWRVMTRFYARINFCAPAP